MEATMKKYFVQIAMTCSMQMMIFYKSLVVAIATVLSGMLFGCASSPEPTPQSSSQARIRVFHGASAQIYFGDVCDDQPHPVIQAAAGGFSYLVPNKRIGMPQTDDMPTFSYHEYAIPAEQPVTVRMYWQAQVNGVWESCGPIYKIFWPEINQDYDVSIKFGRSGMCEGIEIRKFTVATDGKISTNLEHSIQYRKCKW
jgi:hypothetical protein